MQKETILFHIDALKEDYYALLERICNIESNARDFDKVREVGQVLCDFARQRGFKAVIKEYENAGASAIISMNDDAPLAPIMLSGHMDTVYSPGDFGYPPARREGDTLFGPGTADCKGGIVVALLCMEALKKSGFVKRPVRLFLQCDEEVGSRYSGGQSLNDMIFEASRCAAFLNCENARPGYVTLERKGILGATIAVYGVAAHAKDYSTGASAVCEAAYKIIRLHQASCKGDVAYNCTLIPNPVPANCVPDRQDIRIDSRVSSMTQTKEVKAFISEVANHCTVPNTRGEVLRFSMRPPMEKCEKNTRLFEKINRILSENGLPTYAPYASAGGADASNVSISGVPTLDSMGVEGALYHTKKEYCNLSSMAPRALALGAIIADF